MEKNTQNPNLVYIIDSSHTRLNRAYKMNNA